MRVGMHATCLTDFSHHQRMEFGALTTHHSLLRSIQFHPAPEVLCFSSLLAAPPSRRQQIPLAALPHCSPSTWRVHQKRASKLSNLSREDKRRLGSSNSLSLCHYLALQSAGFGSRSARSKSLSLSNGYVRLVVYYTKVSLLVADLGILLYLTAPSPLSCHRQNNIADFDSVTPPPWRRCGKHL